jgi:two-component system sensor histidine kinase KdpD
MLPASAPHNRFINGLVPYAVSVAVVGAVALVAHALTRLTALPHVSMLFLVAVVVTAAFWGFWPAVFAAVLSVAAASFFFYAPIFSFLVADARNVADLAVFVIAAAVASRLAAGMRARALEAEQRADDRVKAQGEALREALINSVTHDLQTPLAAILGSASALESLGAGAEPGARRELVAAIREEAERLSSYIENVLDLTRIRSGHMAPRLELVELPDIVDAALRRKRKALERHSVEVALPADLPMLKLDLFLMEHALANLLDNAAKYAPAGSALRISARREEGEVVLEVADSGSGIAAQDLARVFEAFYRGAAGEDRPATGTGLGLAICRAFVEANGGTVAALSAGAGQGATLRIRLPVPEGAVQPEGALAED